MAKKFIHVYQFKIALNGIKPPIWRRIQVPENYTFWDLHVAIQCVMGWAGYHLHTFLMYNPFFKEKVYIEIPNEENGISVRPILDEKTEKIAHWFSMENKNALYVYDFGDGWNHKIVLEKILPRDKNIEYPVCIGGKRACPPEDCGGTWGYEEFLEAIKDPKHPRHEELLEWVGGSFDPEDFDKNEVEFDDPDEEWKEMIDFYEASGL